MTVPNYCPATIPAGGTKTPVIKLSGQQIVGFYTPGTLVGTAMTFNMTPDVNANPPLTLPVKASSGSALSFTVTTSSYYGFTVDQMEQFIGVNNIQLVSGSTETTGAIITLALIPRQSI